MFKNRCARWAISLILLAVSVHHHALAGANPTEAGQNIQNELSLQEEILEQILSHYDKNGILGTQRITGHYIAGFGILFESLNRASALAMLDRLRYRAGAIRRYRWDDDSGLLVSKSAESDDKRKTEIKKRMDQNINNLHQAVYEFLADYFSLSSLLKSGERVTIYLDLNTAPELAVTLDSDQARAMLPAALQATLPMRDLVNFRKKKLSPAALKKKIKMERIFSKSDDYSYKILTRILSRSLGTLQSAEGRSNKIDVSYLKFRDFGVLFFLESNMLGFAVPAPPSAPSGGRASGYSSETLAAILNENNPHQEETNKKLITGFKDQLSEIIGKYASNLEDIKTDQWVLASVRMDGFAQPQTRFILKVLKKDIDEYASQRITLKQFKARIKIFDEGL